MSGRVGAVAIASAILGQVVLRRRREDRACVSAGSLSSAADGRRPQGVAPPVFRQK